MRSVNSSFLLFLDFDGVVCDSLPECLVSSWTAYFHILKGVRPNHVSTDLGARFNSMRSYIRSGEDYVLIQQLIDIGKKVNSQQEFDSFLATLGNHTMASYKDIFYRARTELLNSDRQYWLALNRVYAHMKKELRAIDIDAPIKILSTKKVEFIIEILKANGIQMNPQNVCYSGAEKKLAIISDTLDQSGISKAVFIDDQIDHIKDCTDKRIECFLPSWGFVQKEWLEIAPVIDPEQTTTLFSQIKNQSITYS